jgi:hypothetical protein
MAFPATLESIAAELDECAAKTRAVKPCYPVNTSADEKASHQAKLEASAEAYERAASIIRHQIECEA